MVERIVNLDFVFGSLADPTRRDILHRVAQREQSVGQIAKHYDLTFAAVSKHLKVLEKAMLVTKRRMGKEQMVSVSTKTLSQADEYLQQYREMWEHNLDRLEELLEQEQHKASKERG